ARPAYLPAPGSASKKLSHAPSSRIPNPGTERRPAAMAPAARRQQPLSPWPDQPRCRQPPSAARPAAAPAPAAGSGTMRQPGGWLPPKTTPANSPGFAPASAGAHGLAVCRGEKELRSPYRHLLVESPKKVRLDRRFSFNPTHHTISEQNDPRQQRISVCRLSLRERRQFNRSRRRLELCGQIFDADAFDNGQLIFRRIKLEDA